MGDGSWEMEVGRWKMEVGRWKMEDGRWKLEVGRWKLEFLRRPRALQDTVGAGSWELGDPPLQAVARQVGDFSFAFWVQLRLKAE